MIFETQKEAMEAYNQCVYKKDFDIRKRSFYQSSKSKEISRQEFIYCKEWVYNPKINIAVDGQDHAAQIMPCKKRQSIHTRCKAKMHIRKTEVGK